MKNKIAIFGASALALVILFILGARAYKKGQMEAYSFLAIGNSEVFVRAHSPIYGQKEAKVYITEFLDPECESCRRFYPEVKELLNKYQGKVQLAVRYATFHKNSELAVRALEAAKMQGKYWESLSLLFEKQPEWGNHQNPKPELIFVYLKELGLDIERLKTDMQRDEINKILMIDEQDMIKLGVRGTPTFFVNGRPLESFGMEFLEKAVNEEIDKLY